MGEGYVKKNGLLYSADFHTVLGVDDTSSDFNGRIPFGAHSIDDEVFSDCPYESISVPDSVTHIGNAVFENSKALEKVKLPCGIKELPPYLFSGCSALTKVTMPNELSGFPEGLFKDCASLQEIPFRAGLTVLPENVFSGCVSLKSLVIPNTVQTIGPSAVAGCTGLESLVIPASVQVIAANAFEGCTSIHNIRVEGDNELFFVKPEDGCLYMKTEDGDNLIVKAYGVQNSGVSFFKENVDDDPIEGTEDEDEEEDDTFFSAEIGASAEELNNIQNTDREEKTMEENNIDSMLADIMGAEKERSAVTEDVGISDKESELLSETMSVMAQSSQSSANVAVSNDELEKLFSKHEEEEQAARKEEADPAALDSKAQILVDSVDFGKVLTFEPAGDVPEDPDLFVIAEKTVTDAAGNKAFSAKLTACCKTFARIHDFRHVVMLSGLPLDNDEFMQFYHHYMSHKNVILACEAASPSLLSDYAKTVCEESRINLDKEVLNDQRKRITIKTDTLIKLVIRDKYED